jgi:hypothetical protein
MDKCTSPIGIQSVSVRNQPQSAWSIGYLEPEATGVQVVVNRNAHPGKDGEVEGGPPRSREVEVEQSDGTPVPEDDVLQTYVVVADNGPTGGISQLSSLQGPSPTANCADAS